MAESKNLSDVPLEKGKLSPALAERLARDDLQDLDILFRYRGVRTLRALLTLECNDRAVLLQKARDIYEILGYFPSTLKTALEQVFRTEGSHLQGSFDQGARQSVFPSEGCCKVPNPYQPGQVTGTSSASMET